MDFRCRGENEKEYKYRFPVDGVKIDFIAQKEDRDDRVFQFQVLNVSQVGDGNAFTDARGGNAFAEEYLVQQ